MKIFSSYDDHIFFIDFNNFLRDYKDKNFSFFNTSVEDNDKHISKLFENYDYDKFNFNSVKYKSINFTKLLRSGLKKASYFSARMNLDYYI